jgi:hypothetical protein
LIRGTLIVASVLVLLGLAWIAADWARLNFVPSPKPRELPADAFVRHAGYEGLATRAMAAFDAMPASRQLALIENLEKNLGELGGELARLDDSRLSILCIGERHFGATRRFLAESVFPALAVDVLLLETPDDALPMMMSRIDAGEVEVPLLGADIAAVVGAARRARPGVVVAGIDESTSQKAQRIHRGYGSRDISIAGNLRSHLRRGKRHAVLFGALHCADQPNWMYRRIQLGEHRVSREEIRNVNIIGEHQDGTLEAFLAFIHAIGVERRQFMVADVAALDRLVFSWFPGLTRSFQRFNSVIVFREHGHGHSPLTPG